ncbi:hypothetical protein ABZ446_01880 [Streptomyces sp. NPDC005813]|uniref:hypothetical protein n=1 Tax=Streptomyces sp. NPDC005813 TaxID=3155592 RepID=UPI0033F318B6
MSTPTVTFSGAHPYRPQCVVDSSRRLLEALLPDTAAELAVLNAERITKAIDSGICPRCSDPLRPDGAPDDWRPAGSRATSCRCIPVCETCANWIEPILGASAVTAWPTDQDDGDEGTQKEQEAAFVQRLKTHSQLVTVEFVTNGLVFVSDDGVTPIQMRAHPGGWLEHGYDDTADQRERQS